MGTSSAPGDDQPAAAGAQPPAAAPGLVPRIAASLRRERDRAGLSLTELARRAGIAKSTLSQLESGTGNPSVETLWGLAVALGVPVSRLVEPPRPNVQVIRAGDGLVLQSEQASYAATLLASCPPGARRDIFRLVVQPGEPRVSDPHHPGTTEHIVLSTGRARVGPATEPVEIRAGDYVTYPGDAPHVFEALAPDTTGVIVLEHI